MDRSIAEHLQEVTKLCRQYKVSRLELFGSAVGDHFDSERSDVDFLVEFEPLAEGEHADAYFGLLESLQSLFTRHVDLVMTRAIHNRYFLEAIQRTQTLIYAA